MKKSQMGFRWVMAAAVLVLIAGGMAPVQADDLAAF